MNWRHDLRLVRMNTADGTLHCDEHGLLPIAEAEDVLSRSLPEHLIRQSRQTWKTKLIDLAVRQGAHCEPLT